MNAKANDSTFRVHLQRLTDLGWYIFPLRPRKKTPACKWRDESTNNLAEAEKLFARHFGVDANVGVDCGKSGLVVIDLDRHEKADGVAAWEALKGAHNFSDTEALVTETPSGGRHVIFTDPTDGAIRNSVGQLAPGVDVRASGGYIVAPPSSDARGSWRWVRFGKPGPAPQALVQLLLERPRDGNASGVPVRHTASRERYAQAALERETTTLAKALRGGRNRQANASAFSLGQLVGAGLLTREEVERELFAACEANGLVSDDGARAVMATIASGLQAGMQEPRDVPEARPGRRGRHTEPDETRAPKMVAALNALPDTDAGNGEAMALLYGDRLRFNHDNRQWLIWDGRRWRYDRDGEPERLAKEMARQRLEAAAQEPDDDRRQQLVKWALKSESRIRLQAALAQAATERPIAAVEAAFDAAPHLLGAENGVVDLQTGELLAGRPDLGVTLSTGIEYDPAAQAPRWEQFLREIFAGDSELIDYIQRAIGYSLTGDTSEQVLHVLWGTGANGKSVFLAVLHAIMGEYAHNAEFATFLAARPRDGGAASPDLYAMRGRRLVTASEVSADRRLNEARIKSLTGGDPITARPLYGRPVVFRPVAKFWLAVNHKPRIVETSTAIWRRVRLIPFTQTFHPGDPTLERQLRAERVGILAWAVRGALRWHERGLAAPATVSQATEAYRSEQDVLAQYIGDCCHIAPHATARASQLYQAYQAWCNDNGEQALSGTAFGRLMGERYEKQKEGGCFWYRGIGLRASSDGDG